ncbi:MAG: hypothetical protein U0457_13490 [Candidatus Sericytochromatia bacterium]
MKEIKLSKAFIFAITILSLSMGYSCDSSLSFGTTRNESKPLEILANINSGVSGSSVRISNLKNIPSDIKNANSIKVVMDSSKVTFPVTRNSDGSLSFNVPSSVKINSNGDFNAVFILDDQKSYLVTLKTGSQVKLESPGVVLSNPTGAIIKGEKIKLTANISKEFKGNLNYNWYYTTNPASGQFFSISGNNQTVEWTPNASGGYFIKVDMIDKETGAISTYTTPASTIFVTDAKDIFSISPSSGTVLRGKDVNLSLNLPNLDPSKYDFAWSVGASAQGPFTSVSGSGQNVDWSTSNSGNFYVKVDVLNKETNQNSSYTSSEPIIFVTENENIIATEPSQGNVARGGSIKLTSNAPVSESSSFSWFYAASPQGPWQSIAGGSKSVDWTPPLAGSFYVKTDVVDSNTKNVSTFTSPKAIVFVSEASNVFKTLPIVANVRRGSYVTVSADIPGAVGKNYQYNWSISTSAQGPFQAIFNASGDSKTNNIRWRPANEGSYFVKVDAVNIDNQQVVSFTSPNPIVFVNELTPLFKTSPEIARITKDQTVEISVDVESPINTVFAWSYGPSTLGPWTAIGGSTSPKIVWDKKGKTSGTYYIKVDIKDSVDNTISNFISRSPIVFVDQDQQTSSSATFGSF